MLAIAAAAILGSAVLPLLRASTATAPAAAIAPAPEPAAVIPAAAIPAASAPASAAVDQLAFRVALLERRAVAPAAAAAPVDGALSLLALHDLRRRLDAGEVFDQEAAALRRFAPAMADLPAFLALEALAPRGVETTAALAQQFAQLRPMLDRHLQPASGVVDRIWRGWQWTLVTLAVSDPMPEPAAIALRRVEEALARADARAALEAAATLDGEPGTILRPWLTALRARVAADGAAEALRHAAWQRVLEP